MNILFVCLGNICRSPLAEGIMQHLYSKNGLSGIIESAGTADFNLGRPADHRSISVAQENGIDIRNHRARQICASDFQRFDHIFAMDSHNVQMLTKYASDQKSRQKVQLLAGQLEIADPYNSDMAAFRKAFTIVKTHCLQRLALHPDLKTTAP